jgi:hypothetical protein
MKSLSIELMFFVVCTWVGLGAYLGETTVLIKLIGGFLLAIVPFIGLLNIENNISNYLLHY